MKELINKIINYFKNFFISLYKSETIDETLEDKTETNDSTIHYRIHLRGYIKDYSITDLYININNIKSVYLPEPLNYKEEYIIETDCDDDTLLLEVKNSIECIDGEVLPKLGFTKIINKGEVIINITDSLLGLKKISFNASVEDYEPVKSVSIHL